MISMVLILPAALREAGDALAVALGHDTPPGHTYSVPLSASGAPPATHFGCHTWASPGFGLLLDAAAAGTADLPPGVDAAAVAAVMAALVRSARDDGPAAGAPHFADVLAAHGLAIADAAA